MTDQQTAHRILENVKFKSKDKSEIWALREAQDALIKRSPAKVKYGEYNIGKAEGFPTASCPACDWQIEEYEDTWQEPFCPHCGQALDWKTEAAEKMTRRKIKDFRKIVLPFISKHLLDIDYEGQGKCDTEEFAKDFNEILDLASKALEQEPKVGHWVEKEYHFENCWAECSICGKTARGVSTDTGWGFEYSFSNYCPNCGAKMAESEAAEQ